MHIQVHRVLEKCTIQRPTCIPSGFLVRRNVSFCFVYFIVSCQKGCIFLICISVSFLEGIYFSAWYLCFLVRRDVSFCLVFLVSLHQRCLFLLGISVSLLEGIYFYWYMYLCILVRRDIFFCLVSLYHCQKGFIILLSSSGFLLLEMPLSV